MLAKLYKIPIPPLERLSDVLFINWLHLAGPDPSRVAALKYVFRFNVKNPLTKAVIKAIETRDNSAIGAWPGRTFPLSEKAEGADAVALLGTPNGVAVAFLLSQHKAYFPQKTISSATVWTSENPDIEDDEVTLTHIVFTIEPLLQPDPNRWGCCD